MNIFKRFYQICDYNPSKGKLNEAYGDVDATGWICVGEVPYWPWGADKDKKLYIMVNPVKTRMYGEYINEVVYTENSDGTGRQASDIPSFKKRNQIIYDEHQDDEFGEMFLGKRKSNEEIEAKHKDFLSKLFLKGNNVIIHHNTSFKITDGVVKRGVPNSWSNNTDIGCYFWGSRNCGKDPSNAGMYAYYCIIPLSDLYDFESNVDRLSVQQAMRKYKYVGQLWKDSDAVAVMTYEQTPIWCVLDKQTGKWYDSKWNEISTPF